MKEFIGIGYDTITELVPVESRVLDLGCGDGSLLFKLQQEKKVRGFGVEISAEDVSLCVEKGLYCYQADIDEGLSDYRDNSFDYVILNQTIQSTKRPDRLMREILRIGKKAIVSFPNFAHISVRRQFTLSGTMPKSPAIPYEWYETPNIHMVTINDFESLCREKDYRIEKRLHFSISAGGKVRRITVAPNLLAQYGFFVLMGAREDGNPMQ
jgi:methionine biosynthesis protein MetW